MQEENIFSKRTFQEKVIQALILDKFWAQTFIEILNIDESFDYAPLKVLAKEYIGHYKQYKEFPSNDLLKIMIGDTYSNPQDMVLKSQALFVIEKIEKGQDVNDLAWVKDKAFEFCKQQNLKKALVESASLVGTDQYEKVIEIMKEAIAAGTPNTSGHDYLEDFDARYSETYRNCIATKIPKLDDKNIMNGGLGSGELGIVVAPSGCHKKGTKILMFDGSIKNVEDVRVGDKLMGADSKPRNVLNLARGKSQMYTIIPTKGESFTVNDEHILSLRNSKTNKIVNISVNDYLKTSKNFKNLYKLYRSNEIEFQKEVSSQELEIDPYILGVLIGDGSLSSECIEITTADIEIDNEIRNFALKENLGITKHKQKNSKAHGLYFTNNHKHNNPLIKKLEKLKLINTKSGDKFIPEKYKVSSVENRLKLLAGLIDTDGSLSSNCFDFVTKSYRLATDILFISRSLGFSAYMKKTIKKSQNGTSGLYYRITISGKGLEKIPTKIKRKQAKERKQIKNTLNTGFSLQKENIDDFYGFALDGDHLFLLGDFTVTHNTGKTHCLIHLAASALLQQKNVIYYTLELSERLVGLRFDSHLCNIPNSECAFQKEEIKNFLKDLKDNNQLGRLIIKEYPVRSTTVNTIRNHIERQAFKGFKTDLIVVDYAGILRSAEKLDLPRLEMQHIVQDLRKLSKELMIPVWTALQANREGAKAEVIDITELAESFGPAMDADFIIGLQRPRQNRQTGFGNIFIAKNRFGIDGIKFPIHLDTSKSKLTVLDVKEESDDDGENDDDEQLSSKARILMEARKSIEARKKNNKLIFSPITSNSNKDY